VDLQGVTMIASPYKKPVVQTAAAKPASSPGDFPKVDSGMQKARDSDRLQILTEEMRNEEKKLESLKAEFNNGEPERRGDERNYAKYQDRVAAMKEDISRTEKNIEALKREIGNLK
jgi:predicted RNase H-like nuclease (RuvC/YqgF family)